MPSSGHDALAFVPCAWHALAKLQPPAAGAPSAGTIAPRSGLHPGEELQQDRRYTKTTSILALHASAAFETKPDAKPPCKGNLLQVLICLALALGNNQCDMFALTGFNLYDDLFFFRALRGTSDKR